MISTLVYPFGKQFYPIVKNAKKLERVWIKHIVSPLGWGLSGKEYSTGNNSLTVETDFKACLDDCQLLWIVDSYEELNFEKTILPLIDYAIFKGKRLLYTRAKNKEEEKIISQRYKNALITQLHCNEDVVEALPGHEYKELITPVIAIGELYDGLDSLESQLALASEFADRKLNVLQYSYRNECRELNIFSYPTFLYQNNMNFKQKVFSLNSYFKHLESQNKPDLILLSIPFGLSEFSTKCSSHLGYFAHLISKALSIDLGVVNLPFLDCVEKDLNQIAFEVFHRYGIPVEYFNMCSKLLLPDESEIYGVAQYLELDVAFVKSKVDINNIQSLYMLEAPESAVDLVEKILCRLTCFGKIKII